MKKLVLLLPLCLIAISIQAWTLGETIDHSKYEQAPKTPALAVGTWVGIKKNSKEGTVGKIDSIAGKLQTRSLLQEPSTIFIRCKWDQS